MNKKKRLFVDMDGTLARFHDEVRYLERMYEDGFFLQLNPFLSVVEAVDELALNPDLEVYILSSCVTEKCKEEKLAWVNRYLSNIPSDRCVLVDVGCNKALCFGRPLSANDYLLDDYNVNLGDWQAAGGHAIKLVNNINHKGMFGPLWKGECCYEADVAEKIKEDLLKIIFG